MLNEKIEPCPLLGLNCISPPSNSTNPLATASPKPSPLFSSEGGPGFLMKELKI